MPRVPLPRLPSTMRARYMLAFASTITVAMVATILLVNERMGRLLLDATRDKSTAIAQSLGATTANALLNYDYVSLAQAADNAVDQSGIDYVVILDKEGRVAAQSGRGVLGGDEIPDLPWSELSEQQSTWTRTLSVGGGDGTRHILDVAHPVYVEGSDVRWGVVRLGLDLDPMRRAILRVRLLLAAIGVVALVLALAAARFVSDRIGRSLGGLVEGTLEIARGNLDHRIAPRSDDEIATVARHFNYMAAQVRRQQTELAIAKSELEALNATLEEKVLRRTRELVASEEKYRVLVDQSPDPILIVQGGAVRFVNPAFERLVGHRVPNHEDLRAEILFPADERGRATGFLDEVYREGTSTGGEFRVVTKAGAERTFEMRGMRITYLAAPAVALAMHDTTERKELQESLVRHEKLRALGELASGVAHDFNNILGIILGRSQLLQRRATDNEVRRGLQTIERAAFDGGETVRRIQDFARARTERNFSDVDLNTLLTEVVEITRTRWRDQAEVRNVRIEMKLALGRLANVLGHPSELREIFTNLIFNAVDAMPGGGRIEIRSRTEDGHAVVEVADSGCGIPESTRSRIFDPFFSTKGEDGLGLGLSVVYGIVQRHGGAIEVDSTPGAGTTVRVRVPNAPVRGSAEQEATSAPVDGAGRRILAIDDEEAILELVQDILTEQGFEVVTASGGQEAIAKFEPGRYDLVVSDLGLRDMSGWEVVNAIRSRDAAVGVLLLTGWGATLSPERVEEYGIDAVMNKPFEMGALLRRAGEVLEQTERRRVAGEPTG